MRRLMLLIARVRAHQRCCSPACQPCCRRSSFCRPTIDHQSSLCLYYLQYMLGDQPLALQWSSRASFRRCRLPAIALVRILRHAIQPPYVTSSQSIKVVKNILHSSLPSNTTTTLGARRTCCLSQQSPPTCLPQALQSSKLIPSPNFFLHIQPIFQAHFNCTRFLFAHTFQRHNNHQTQQGWGED